MIISLRRLNPSWQKAAILGSVWGSVEIILGSFLHNLRIPFAGTMLSAVGIALCIAGRTVWPERGLIWRAGLVCALMKSVSPSAVILGPMAGILSEAVVLEGILSLTGGLAPGMLLGGGITACLPLLQMILGLLISYGLNIGEVVARLYDVAVGSLGLIRPGPAAALGLFFGLNAALGIGAAIAGIVIGRRALADHAAPAVQCTTGERSFLPEVESGRTFSLLILITLILSLPVVFIAIRDLPVWGSLLIVSLSALWIGRRYPKAIRRLMRPWLWIQFIGITLLASWLLGDAGSSGNGYEGLITGIRMTFRALYTLLVFSAVSVELRNPVIIGWFLRRGLGQLSMALDLGFSTLPVMTGILGDRNGIVRHPVQTLTELISAARRLAAVGPASATAGMVCILSGETGTGKSSAAGMLVDRLRKKGMTVGGILAPGIGTGGSREGYDVEDLKSGRRMILCRNRGMQSGVRTGRYVFSSEAIAFGRSALAPESLDDCGLVIVDEVGPLELAGEGWAPAIPELVASDRWPILLVVRTSLVDAVQERWRFRATVITVGAAQDPAAAAEELLSYLEAGTPQYNGGGALQ